MDELDIQILLSLAKTGNLTKVAVRLNSFQLYHMTAAIQTENKPGRRFTPAGLVHIQISTAFRWIFTLLL